MRHAVLVIALACLGWWVPASAQTTEPVGEAVARTGPVTVHRDGASSPLETGAPVYVEDRVVTGPDARLQLEMADGAEIVVGAETELVVAEYVVRGGERETGVWDLVRGILRATLPGDVLPTPFDVRTGVATASARSTTFIVEAEPPSAAILAVEGRVEVSAADGSIGAVLAPGFGLDVAEGEAPQGPRQWPEARVQSFIERTSLR